MRETILSKIVEILNMGKTQLSPEDIGLDLCEVEKNTIFFINRISKNYHCFTPEEIPYSYYEDEDWSELKVQLTAIATMITNKLISSKIYDFIWLKCKDFESAIKAFNGFVEIIADKHDYETNFFLFNRCVSIFELTKQEELEFNFIKALYNILDQGKDDDCAFSFNILELAYHKKYLPLPQLIPLMRQKLEYYSNTAKDAFYIDMSCLLERAIFDKNEVPYTQKICKIKAIQILRRNRADHYIKLAEDQQHHPSSRIDSLKKAIVELKGLLGTEEERRQLHGRLSILQKLLSESMHTFSHSFDMTSTIKHFDEVASKLDNTELFYYFIYCTDLFDYQSGQDSLIKIEGQMFSKHLSREVILGKSGSVKAIMPSWTEALKSGVKKEMLPHVEKHCAEMYAHRVNAGMTYLLNLLKKRDFSIDPEVDNIVKSSVFIPQSRKNTFVKALTLGFEGDFTSSISIIAPQVENAVRELAIACGDAVTKLNPDTTEELISLDQILQLPKLNECIDEKILFNIKLIFSSNYGFNIRNEVAHGIYDDEDFKSVQSFFVWWFILRICIDFSILKYENIKNINSKLGQL